MSVWASIFEQGTPIPFLGLEAANALTQSVADRLLEDAIRMISVDAYRLATIVHAYASCAKSLQLRLLLDPQAVRLQSRVDTMRNNLFEAKGKLGEARERRDYPDPNMLDDDRMDPMIQRYIKGVETRAEQILKHLDSHI